MQCPVCTNQLNPVDYEGVTIDVCDSCGGEFLDHDELGHIVRVREMSFSAEAKAALADHTPVFGVPVEEQRRKLSCPKCASPMATLNYSSDSGVYIDRCEACGGFWLDVDELEQVQILQERWADEAPIIAQQMAGKLEEARRQVGEATNNAFSGSRFAFVNALVNRMLDAA